MPATTSSLLSVIIALTNIAAVHGYKLSHYQGQQCRSAGLGPWIGGPGQGCQQNFKGVAASVVISSTGSVDDPFTVVFFKSDDCMPTTDNILSQQSDGCFTGNYGSYEVWDLSD